jgi:hypothetical protein
VSPTAARLLALPFVLLAFGLRLVLEFWITPLTWRLDSAWALLAAWIVSLAASVAIPLGAYLLLTRRARLRQATWQLDGAGHRFSATVSPRWVGPWAIIMGFLAGGLIVTERVPGENRMRVADFDYAAPISLVLVITMLAAIILLVLLDRPRIVLDPEAITLRFVRGVLRIPWTELAPGGPLPPAKPNPRTLLIYRVTAGQWVPLRLPANRLHVDTAFLAHTIRYYADDPAWRSAIGTENGLAALRSSFPALRDAPAQTPG